jgi:hypothetical protein
VPSDIFAASAARISMTQEKSIQIAIDQGDLEAFQTLARHHKVDLEVEPKPQILDPISIILIGGGVIAVTKFTVDLIDKYRGGIIVDLRPSAKRLVSRDKSVPAGWALVVAADGKINIDVKDAPKDALERWVSEIIQGVLKNAKDVAAAAAKAFGDDKVKSD